jgi:glycoside/pentoside/hexuronide:cation symporter, GPH family
MSVPTMMPSPALADPHPLPLAVKLLYGVGEMPITVLMVLSGLFILFFYNSVMGLPASLVGIGLFASLVLDAVLDPYIGHLSDGVRSRFGRRHAFMLPGALAMGPCFFLLFSPPRSFGHAALFLWMLVWSVAVRVTSATYRIPYLGLGAELSRDYDDRTRTMAIRSFFGLVGTLAATSLSFLLFFPPTADGSEPKLHYAGYPHLGIAFGALMSVSGLVCLFGTLRYRTSGEPKTSETPHFLSAFRISMGNSSFRKIWFSSTFFFLAVVLNFSLAINYFTWYAKVTGSGTLSFIQTCFNIGALAGVIMWLVLSRRAEKRNLYLAGMVATALVLLSATLLVGAGRLFGTGNALPLLFGNALAGIFASAYWVLPPSMVADVTDTDQLATGRRREGIYYGILNFGEKIAAGGALFLSGMLLTVFRKLSHGAVGLKGQPPVDINYLGILYGAAPAALILISLASLITYRLDRSTVHDVQRQLAARAAGTV